MKRGGRINQRSAKTAERDAEYAIQREIFLRERRRCEIRWEGCSGWATDVHHMAGRLPSVFFNQELWKAACRGCHRLVTDNPARAYAAGVSVHRNAQPLPGMDDDAGGVL